MDVGLYVSQLLDELNAVSLPGIGTFYHKNISAYFDEKQGIFFPPSKKFTFSSGNPETSLALIEKICSERNISEPSARYFIEKYSETIRQSLQIKGYVEIGSAGKLKVKGESYTFEPSSVENDAFTYGLTPVMELKRAAFKTAEPDFSAIRTKTAATTDEPENTDPVSRSNKTGLLILLTLLIVIAGTAALYFYYPQFFHLTDQKKNQVQKSKQAEAMPVAPAPTLEDSLAKADSIIENSFAELQKEGITVEKPRDTMNISTSSSSLSRDSVKLTTAARYEIICASFNRKSEAETSVQLFRKRGIDATIINDSKRPFYKVSLGSFTDFEAANNEKRRIQKDITKDAWILKIKNN